MNYTMILTIAVMVTAISVATFFSVRYLFQGGDPASPAKLANLDNPASYQYVPPSKVFAKLLAEQIDIARVHMFKNISTKQVKETAGSGTIVPAAGSVLASPNSGDPDYFFHWLRDAANVIKPVGDLYHYETDPAMAAFYLKALDDYATFNSHLQRVALTTPYGLAEVRFNADGTIDTTKWSRPQLDGPALRALSLLHFLKVAEEKGINDAARVALVIEIIQKDLDYLAINWATKGYDIWESYSGEYYVTRVAALSALMRGANFFADHNDPQRAEQYHASANLICDHLDLYWRADEGVLAYSKGTLTDIYDVVQSAPGNGIDSGLIMGLVEADVPCGKHSVLDPRVMRTVAITERIFADAFAINKDLRRGPGVAMGRHIGDSYYGGNAFYFLTAGYAEYYYKLAARIEKEKSLIVTVNHHAFLAQVALRMAKDPWPVCTDILASSTDTETLVSGLRQRGDDFLWMIMTTIPASGEMSEQFDRTTGEPRSAQKLSWSYSSFIAAGLARKDAVRAENSLRRKWRTLDVEALTAID